MRNPNSPHRANTIDTDDLPNIDTFETDAAAERGERLGTARHIANGGKQPGDIEEEFNDGDDGPSND